MPINDVRTPRFVERIQRAELGGSPASNDEGFGHGAPVWIVDKRQLLAVLYRAAHHARASNDKQLLTCLQPFFDEDAFVFRGDDLPV